jgi:hypothetical protein
MTQVLTEVMPDQIRDRVIEVKKMRLGDIQSHPNNPKYHPLEQRELVGNLLTEIGWAGAAIAYYSERADGKLVYIDAHLRKSLAPDFEGQIIITDLDDREADILVALYDESGSLAEIDPAAFDALARTINTGNALFQKALSGMAERGHIYSFDENQKSLDDLEGEYGEPGERDFWPMIKVQVSPECMKRWNDLMGIIPSQDEATKVKVLLGAVDESLLGSM